MEAMLSGAMGPMERVHMVMMAFTAPTVAKLMVAVAATATPAMLRAKVGSVAKAQLLSPSTVLRFVCTEWP